MTNENISGSGFHHRNKHTAVLEGINEEQGSLEDEETDNEEAHRKNGTQMDQLDVKSASDHDDDDEEPKHLTHRSLSVSNAALDEKHRFEAEQQQAPPAQRYTRHMSIDQRGGNLKHPTPISRDQDAIDRYYERNHYTVTGRDRNVDFYNKLPLHLQHRMGGTHNFESQSRVSRMSSPGALGEPVVPTTRRFDKSVYWFVFNRKKIGFRHIFIVLFVIFYTLLGATVFYTIESANERKEVMIHEKNLEELLTKLAENITERVNDPNTSTNTSIMKDYIKTAYIDLMKLEGQYKGSTYYKLEEGGNNWKWTFDSAFFFSMNVYTTTGYGSIAPETTLGQFFTILYGFIFVPCTLVALRDLGQFFLVQLTKLYAHTIQKYRDLIGDKNVDQDEIIRLPIRVCLSLLSLYLAGCTMFIYFYDDLLGPEPGTGMSLFLCFYFSFISLSTIGLGDIMPNNATFSPIISIMFFVGMAVTKVVNRSTYIAVENGIFGVLTLIDNKLDSMFRRVAPEPPQSTGIKTPQRQGSIDAASIYPDESANEMLNNATVRSIANFMKSNADIYGGGFGRVQLRRGDLMNYDNQNTVTSLSQIRNRANSASQNAKDQGNSKEPV
ncbi:unnamed protein product [Caenorhabditis bovis]|uniref:Potassium channel domain-containing protein n=1 Tax=Caenorhabditis bovis TaxID=2654633 RepID=A0A8S1EKR8_9PELO|nr:unnamed protein product [Caenorhabditis bovis]